MRRIVTEQAWLLFQVADLIGADPKEIIFTSGATESNNLAIKGISNFYRDRKKHIITTQTERECPWVCSLAKVKYAVYCQCDVA